MQINIKGLINRLDHLRERLHELFDKLDKFDDLEIEEMAIEDIDLYFRHDDTFNLSIALDILEQAEKLDNVLKIIKEKNIDFKTLKEAFIYHGNNKEQCEVYNVNSWEWVFELAHPGCVNTNRDKTAYLTLEEYELLKEALL